MSRGLRVCSEAIAALHTFGFEKKSMDLSIKEYINGANQE
jgi:hypothetical protein